METIINNLSVKVRDKTLYELNLGIDSFDSIRVPGFMIEEVLEGYDMDYNFLIGEMISIDFYEKGEVVPEKIRKHFEGDGDTIYKHYFATWREIGDELPYSWEFAESRDESMFWPIKRTLCRQKCTVVKSIKFQIQKPYTKILTQKDRLEKEKVLTSKVLGLQVDIRSKAQKVYFILENLTPLKVESFIVSNATQLEAHEFEMLIGREISFSFFRVGERIPSLNELCQFENSYIKEFQLVGPPIERGEVLLATSKIPFYRIVKISHPSAHYSRKGVIEIFASNGKKYFLDIKEWTTGYEWEYLLLSGSYFYPLESPEHDLRVGKNVLLRLHSIFFKRIRNVDNNILNHYKELYKRALNQSGYSDIQPYTQDDAFRDTFGGHPDASWNID